MINLKSIVQTAFCFLIVSFSLTTKAQSTTTQSEYYFVEMKTITVDSYVKLHNTLKADGTYEISSACIPAHILKIRSTGGKQELASFKQNFELLSQSVGLMQSTILLEYNEEKFIDRCAAARSAGQ